jgi:hypothetical protein
VPPNFGPEPRASIEGILNGFLSVTSQNLLHNTHMAATRHTEDLRLTRLSKICLALPEAARKDSGSHAAFLIRDQTFAYFLDDHHGDGIVLFTCKAQTDENASPADQPTPLCLPADIGPKGWIALRLDRREIDWDIVAELVLGGYCQIAPKRLVALVTGR